MSFLLKIVEGPMNGAEIALVEGLRLRVGSGADCDIVLADATLPEAAFELDVSADSVSLVRGEDVRTLVPFEIFDVGTSAFVIGPAEGAWEPLKRGGEAKEDSGKRREDGGETTGGGGEKRKENDERRGDGEGRGEEGAPVSGAGEDASGKRRGLLVCGCVFVGLLAVLLLAVWFFWPKVAEMCPKAESARLTCVSWIRGVFASHDEQSAPVAEPRPTLADLARQYGLVLTNYTVSSPDRPLASVSHPLLKGNLARRTERMAIRSLAQSADPMVKLELTDDETLLAAASELLFVVTEGAIKVTAATNGVVTLVGYAPSVSSLERTIRALDADVKGITRALTAQVTVGGPPPEDKKTTFPEAKPAAAAPRSRGTRTNPSRDYPIAGILTKPYPMVVMNNGMRLVEGAQIADVTVERIESDRLILRQGTTVFEWKP